MGLPTYRRTRWHDDALLLFRVGIEVKYLQDGFTKIQTHAMTRRCVAFVPDWCVCIRARNPRFYFVHAGTKPRFLTINGHQESGIPCSGLYLCKIFAIYKNTNARDDTTRRCFCFGLARLYRGKIFARWVYPYTNARNDDALLLFWIGAFLSL